MDENYKINAVLEKVLQYARRYEKLREHLNILYELTGYSLPAESWAQPEDLDAAIDNYTVVDKLPGFADPKKFAAQRNALAKNELVADAVEAAVSPYRKQLLRLLGSEPVRVTTVKLEKRPSDDQIFWRLRLGYDGVPEGWQVRIEDPLSTAQYDAPEGNWPKDFRAIIKNAEAVAHQQGRAAGLEEAVDWMVHYGGISGSTGEECLRALNK